MPADSRKGLSRSRILVRTEGVRLLMQTDYNGLGKVQYLLGQRGLPILDSEFADTVRLRAVLPKEQEQEVRQALTEGTNGRIRFLEAEECVYAVNAGEVILLSGGSGKE